MKRTLRRQPRVRTIPSANQLRARTAQTALKASCKANNVKLHQEMQDALVDLLANLMHFAGQTAGYNFEAALSTAEDHYKAEIQTIAVESLEVIP